MIRLTRLNHAALVVNCDLIEHIDMSPDTVLSMTTGQRITVLETAEQVIRQVIEFRRQLRQVPEIRVVEPENEN
jgi:flagellar protein FlbD